MNRDVNGGSDPFNQQAQSSSYLVYLLLLSAGFVLVLPYLFPSSGMLARTGRRVDEVGGRVKSESSSYKRVSPTPYTPLYNGYSTRNVYKYESKCEALEVLVMDLQKVVQAERERTLHLENEIRVMQISETFLKERVQYLEERNWGSRKDSTHSSSMDSLLRNAQFSTSTYDVRRGGADTLVHDLLRMVMMEKDRTSGLESEIRVLQSSETALQVRVQKLEDQFASTCKPSYVGDSKSG